MVIDLIVIIVSISFICSLFLDFNNYVTTIKSGFEDMNHPSISFFGQKNVYARFVFVGIGAVIFLHIYTNKWYWLLFLIPFLTAEVFSFSKMPLFISVLLILSYFIIRLIFFIKKTKDNLIILFSILGFLVIFVTTCSILIAYSETGILYMIKKMFIKFGESASATLKTRFVIYECTFKLLKPFQYIFGFGYALVGNAIHAVYDTKHLEDTRHIWEAHNSYIEMIAQGGIIYLLINVFLIVYLIRASYKVMKHNRYLGLMNIIIISLLLLFQGLTDSILMFNQGDNLFISALVILPIMAEYYNHYDKKEMNIRYKMIEDGKAMSKEKFNFIFDRINQSLYLFAYRFMKNEYKVNSIK